ncbi:MAG: xylulokinase [Alphaproteobacteria bacterium]|nr:MAG: xylulokinase [Alphaproteobacteria bacterium]
MFIGLDLGTSGLRAVLVDEMQRTQAVAEAAYDVSHPQPGWSEQAPDDWIRAARAALGDLAGAHPDGLAGVRAIGLSGQMHGAVLLDGGHKVLRPAILWNDTRAAEEAAALDADPRFRARTGNVVFPGFTAPKLAWLARHEPAVHARIAHVLLPKDHLRLWLTGEIATEMSDAAGTSWLDVGGRAWAEELAVASATDPAWLPDLFEGTEVTGGLRADLAAEFGLRPGTPVVGGGADNAAAAAGMGCLAEGQGFVSLGTSGVVLVARDGYHPAPETAVHTFCHAVPDRWYQMGVMLSATDSLNWLARIAGTTPAALAGALPDEPRGPGPVRFLPYLSGERTPHNDAAIRGVFVGLDTTHDSADLARGVMEGVAFALTDCLDALRETGANPPALIAVGGGSRSRFWVRTLANVLGVPILLPADGELGAAFGAARLAMVGEGGAEPAAVLTQPAVAETVAPDPHLAAAYEEALAAWRQLYPTIRSLR